MKLLVFSDIHGDRIALEKLMAIEADYYFAAGDLVSWGRGLDQLAPVLQRHGKQTFVIPGNHESEHDIREFCETYGFQNFHGGTLDIGDWTIGGLGYSSPTPFFTPGEYSEAEMAQRLAHFDGITRLIMICHAPPKQTDLDRVRDGVHAGSTAVG